MKLLVALAVLLLALGVTTVSAQQSPEPFCITPDGDDCTSIRPAVCECGGQSGDDRQCGLWSLPGISGVLLAPTVWPALLGMLSVGALRLRARRVHLRWRFWQLRRRARCERCGRRGLPNPCIACIKPGEKLSERAMRGVP